MTIPEFRAERGEECGYRQWLDDVEHCIFISWFIMYFVAKQASKKRLWKTGLNQKTFIDNGVYTQHFFLFLNVHSPGSTRPAGTPQTADRSASQTISHISEVRRSFTVQ